jgi:hypothetical protein
MSFGKGDVKRRIHHIKAPHFAKNVHQDSFLSQTKLLVRFVLQDPCLPTSLSHVLFVKLERFPQVLDLHHARSVNLEHIRFRIRLSVRIVLLDYLMPGLDLQHALSASKESIPPQTKQRNVALVWLGCTLIKME